MCDDKQVFLNHLPLAVGYKMEFVFGKCLYQVSVEDVLLGMTDENDLIWVSGAGVIEVIQRTQSNISFSLITG